MLRRRLYMVISPLSVVVLGILHSCRSDEADQQSGDDDGAVPDPDTRVTDSILPLADTASDPDVLRDADSRPISGDGWIDGEYCPSSAYPPRSDGCPCMTGTGERCTVLGKQCDYFQNCPPGPALRYTCKWIRPSEGEPYIDWEISGVPCPPIGNDAAPVDG